MTPRCRGFSSLLSASIAFESGDRLSRVPAGDFEICLILGRTVCFGKKHTSSPESQLIDPSLHSPLGPKEAPLVRASMGTLESLTSFSDSESLLSSTSRLPTLSLDPRRKADVVKRHCRLTARRSRIDLTSFALVMWETVGFRSSSKVGISFEYGYADGNDQCIRRKAMRLPFAHGPFIVMVSLR